MRKLSKVVLATGVCLAAAVAPAQAATTIGETFTPTGPGGGCSGGFTRLQGISPSGQYAAPFDGVVTSWSYQAASAPPQLRFKVARPAGGTTYTVVGQSSLQTPVADQLNTYSGLRIPVQAGDVIGVYLATTGFCGATEPGYTEHLRNDDAQPGFTGAFGLDLPNSTKLDVSALLEPDCDADGLGDETQDADLSACTPTPDTDPPEATITKGAPNKTKKSKVKFKFESNEPGSTFECKKDRKPWKPCRSPTKMKRLDGGKHKFKVRAIDPAGNVGAPDKDKFKVVD